MEQPKGEQKKDLDVFVSELLSEKGLADSAEAHADLLEQVRRRVYLALLAEVPARKLDVLEYYTNEGNVSYQLLEDTIKKSNIDIDKTVDYALEKYKKEFLEAK